MTKLRMRYAGRPASVRVPRELRAVGSDPGEQGAACGTSAAAELRAGGRDAARVGLGTVPADDLERGRWRVRRVVGTLTPLPGMRLGRARKRAGIRRIYGRGLGLGTGAAGAL